VGTRSHHGARTRRQSCNFMPTCQVEKSRWHWSAPSDAAQLLVSELMVTPAHETDTIRYTSLDWNRGRRGIGCGSSKALAPQTEPLRLRKPVYHVTCRERNLYQSQRRIKINCRPTIHMPLPPLGQLSKRYSLIRYVSGILVLAASVPEVILTCPSRGGSPSAALRLA
jgi:hypothetical protein